MADEHHGGQRCRVLDGLHGGRTGFNAWIPCLFKPNGHAGSLILLVYRKRPKRRRLPTNPEHGLKKRKTKIGCEWISRRKQRKPSGADLSLYRLSAALFLLKMKERTA